MRDGQGQPRARTSGVVVKAVGNEVLAYDLTRHRAHSMNGVAAAVWRACDGTRDAAGIATAVRAAGGPAMDAPAVEYALAALGRAHLVTGVGGAAGVTRRTLLRRLGTAAAVPIVTSIVAPTSAQAQSCRPTGLSCTSASACCTPGALCQTTPIFLQNVCCLPVGSTCLDGSDCCSGLCNLTIVLCATPP